MLTSIQIYKTKEKEEKAVCSTYTSGTTHYSRSHATLETLYQPWQIQVDCPHRPGDKVSRDSLVSLLLLTLHRSSSCKRRVVSGLFSKFDDIRCN
jgi:hypothetical protein